MTNKRPTPEESIANAMKMVKSLRGKEVTSGEFTAQCRKFKVRDGLLKYCVERGLCDIKRHKYKNDGKHNLYRFPSNLNVTPRLIKFILDDRANYLRECTAKRKFDADVKEQKRKSKVSVDKSKILKAETKKKKAETEKKSSIAVPQELQKLIDKHLLKTQSLVESIELSKANQKLRYDGWVNSLQKELKQLDKTCLSYLDQIDILEERISGLEKEKEEMRNLFFQIGIDTIKNERGLDK
jgi:hypothetical protein